MLFKALIIPDFTRLYNYYPITIPYIFNEGNFLWKAKGVVGLLNCFCLATSSALSAGLLTYAIFNIYSNNFGKKKTILSEPEEKEVVYEKKYLKELEDLEDRELSEQELNELKTKILREKTPEGDIIIFYNNNTETYWYYTDIRNISYKTLDTVARCYAVTYNVKQICVNYKEEWEQSKAEALAHQNKDDEEDKDAEKKEEENKSKSVFATFKDYNKKSHSHPSIKRRRYRIMTDKANRFTNKGNLDNYNEIEIENENESKYELSFEDFKNLNSGGL